MSHEITPPNPSGLCMCGCGEPAPIARKTSTHWGKLKGHPQKYIKGHRGKMARRVWNDSLWDVRDAGHSTPCWIWKGVTDPLGYGRISKGAAGSALAHRESYVQSGRSIPPGASLDHLCRNPSCVNPDHLDPVTHRENILRGAGTKITPEIAEEIRGLYAERGGRRAGQLRYRDIADMYGVEKRTIWAIVTGRRWHQDPTRRAY